MEREREMPKRKRQQNSGSSLSLTYADDKEIRCDRASMWLFHISRVCICFVYIDVKPITSDHIRFDSISISFEECFYDLCFCRDNHTYKKPRRDFRMRKERRMTEREKESKTQRHTFTYCFAILSIPK